MNWLQRIKIDHSRKSFLRKQKREQKRMLRKKRIACKEADRLTEIHNKRHYVILVVDRY